MSYVQQVLSKHFPESDFDLIKKTGKYAVSHFLLALNQPDESILRWLEVCNKKYHAYINCADDIRQIYYGTSGSITVEATGLSPLSLAALMGRRVVVEAFCSSPHIDCERRDKKGWTPLQHAIARNDPEILASIEKATDAQQLTAGKVVKLAKDQFPFLRQIVRDCPLPQDEVVVRIKDELGIGRSLTQGQFMEMSGGAKFYNGLIGTPASIFRNWYRNEIHSDAMVPWMAKRFDAYCKNKPKLCLSQQGLAGLGVRTERKVRGGDLVAFCGSELISPESENDLSGPYANRVATGKRIRNYGAIVNDGFPNTEEMPLLIDGVEFSGLVALREIQPNEPIFHSYDYSHPIKWGSRVELAMPEILRAFPKSTSPAQGWKQLKKLDCESRDPEVLFDYQSQKAGLVYLFHTPSLLLSLILRGHFDLSSIERLLEDPKFLHATDLDKGAGVHMQKFYSHAFSILAESQKKMPDQSAHFADRFERNVRAGLIALQMTLRLESSADVGAHFDRIYNGAEAFYLSLESDGDLALFTSLEEEDRAAIVALSKQGNVFIFEKSKNLPEEKED